MGVPDSMYIGAGVLFVSLVSADILGDRQTEGSGGWHVDMTWVQVETQP